MAKQDMARERFRGFVELCGLERPYISKAEERRLLEHGMTQFELEPDEARGIVLDVAQVNDIKLERDIDRWILHILIRDGGKNRKISRREFNRAASLYKAMAGKMLADAEARPLVKQVMEANQFRAKRGGWTLSRRWYNRIGEGKNMTWRPALLSRDI